MGVKRLQKGLEEIYLEISNSKEPIRYELSVKHLANKTVAVDASIWMYQGKCAILGSSGEIKNSKGVDVSLITAIFNRVVYLLKCNMKPIFIFDGKPPKFKNETLQQRTDLKAKAKLRLANNDYTDETEKNKLSQRTCKITNSDIKLFKELLKKLGIPYITAQHEADSQCAALFQAKEIDYIISDDSDMIVFGGNKVIRNFKSSTNTVEVFDMDTFYKNTHLTQKDIVDITLLLGCDYYPGIKGIGIKKIIKLITNKEKIFPSEYKTKYVNDIINYFLTLEAKQSITKKMKINQDDLCTFLTDIIEFPMAKVITTLTALKYINY
jgi:flap endonuclease-1